MPATVASRREAGISAAVGGNLKHSHTLKIRRPSVLTPGKYPASLSQLRILRSNYEYGIYFPLSEDFTITVVCARVQKAPKGKSYPASASGVPQVPQ